MSKVNIIKEYFRFSPRENSQQQKDIFKDYHREARMGESEREFERCVCRTRMSNTYLAKSQEAMECERGNPT